MAQLPAPKGVEAAGRALWTAITGTYELEEHELATLAQAVKVADRIAALDVVVDAEGVMYDDPRRGPVAHPALVESRQQRLALARLLTGLRLPDTEDQRPQRRGIRGFYGPRAVSDGA